VDKIKTNLPSGRDHLARFAYGIVRSAWYSPEVPERLWLGTWNLDTLWHLCIGPDYSSIIDEAISSDELMQLRTIVKNVTQPLILAVRELWAAQGAILHPNVPLPSSPLPRLLIPTRDRRKSSKGKTPTQDVSRNHRIDEYTESLAPLPKSTKRKHTPSSSDSVPSHKAATQKFLTTYTSCTGKRKPPSVLVAAYKTSKHRAPTGGITSTGKRIRETPLQKANGR
jgi:hypothetical protein